MTAPGHRAGRRRPKSSWRRLVAAATAVLVAAVVGTGTPAAAHGGTGADATNFLVTVTDPGHDGLQWKVYGGDALLELTNRTGRPVVVAGYQGEPYLWFVPGDGVYVNTRSPAGYLNVDATGSAPVPDIADADAAPVWERVADGDRYGWHDHRAHWMSPDLPPAVAADPDRAQRISTWTIDLTLGPDGDTVPVAASGTLTWVPGVAAWPTIAVVGVAFAALTAAAIGLTRPAGSRWRGLGRTVAGMVIAVAVANLVRTVDDAVSSPATTAEQAVVVIMGVFGVVAVVVLGVVGWRGYPSGFLALGAAGLLTVLLFAVGTSDQLTASQLVTGQPLWVRRYTVAASYLIVIPTFVAAGVGLNRHSRQLRRADPADQPVAAWPSATTE